MQGHSEILLSKDLSSVLVKDRSNEQNKLTSLEAIVFHLCHGVVCGIGCKLGRQGIASVVV